MCAVIYITAFHHKVLCCRLGGQKPMVFNRTQELVHWSSHASMLLLFLHKYIQSPLHKIYVCFVAMKQQTHENMFDIPDHSFSQQPYIGRHGHHSHGEIYQAFPLHFCILKWSKTGWGKPGNRLSQKCYNRESEKPVAASNQIRVLELQTQGN